MLHPSFEMLVDAREAVLPPFWTAPGKASIEIAIVATLVSIALSTYLLRLFTHGRLLRTFALDDGLALMATLCTIGILIAFMGQQHLRIEHHRRESLAGNRKKAGPWILTLDLLHIVGIGLTKVSAAFYLLRISGRRYCRYLIYGLITIVMPSALVWFGSTLLSCIPIASAWDSSLSSRETCMSWGASTTFAAINNVINTSTSLILVLLIIPITSRKLSSAKGLAMVISTTLIGFMTSVAAIIRTQTLFETWITANSTPQHDQALHLWAIIELTTALTATNLPTLAPLSKHLKLPFPTHTHHHHHHPAISAPRPHHPPPNSTTTSRYSSQTVIYRPNTVYLPSLTRFHDDESNLDFDIETQASRTRTHTMQSQPGTHTMHTPAIAHSRNVSDWSQFSGFTCYTNPTERYAVTPSRPRSGDQGLMELEGITRNLGLEKKARTEEEGTSMARGGGLCGRIEGLGVRSREDGGDADGESLHGGSCAEDAEIRLARTRKG